MTAETRPTLVRVNLTQTEAGHCVTFGGPNGTRECRFLQDITPEGSPVSTNFRCAAELLYQRRMTVDRFERLAKKQGAFVGPSGVVQCTNRFDDDNIKDLTKIKGLRR